jgi:hypothetical protein
MAHRPKPKVVRRPRLPAKAEPESRSPNALPQTMQPVLRGIPAPVRALDPAKCRNTTYHIPQDKCLSRLQSCTEARRTPPPKARHSPHLASLVNSRALLLPLHCCHSLCPGALSTLHTSALVTRPRARAALCLQRQTPHTARLQRPASLPRAHCREAALASPLRSVRWAGRA